MVVPALDCGREDGRHVIEMTENLFVVVMRSKMPTPLAV